MTNATINPHGIAWGKVGLAVMIMMGGGFGIGYVTGGASEPPKQPERTRVDPVRTQQVVPTYESQAPTKVERAALTPNLPTGNRDAANTTGTGQKVETGKARGPAKPREKSREQKLWEAHLDAGIGGTDWEEPTPEAVAAAKTAAGRVGGCFLPPTVPMTMQVEYAGYTERGGMLNGVLTHPAMGMGLNCTVLPVGTRVSMEFWGEPGDAQVIEIGFPTFVVPGAGAVQPRPVTGMPADASNARLPDHLSGWVMTPTFSLDAGDTLTLHLRGELHGIH